jgi:orotate phosphoribosyltransferase
MHQMSTANDFRQQFLGFALACDALRFGEFKTKSGRLSPYFFNSGQFNTGAALNALGGYFADALLASKVPFDMVFGPAYKGITLVSALAIGLAKNGHTVPFAHDRKEVKDHGEGGLIVGAPLKGRVVIVDDVITDGAAKRQSIELIRSHGATPAAVLIMVDRMERGTGAKSAVQELEADYGIPVIAIASLVDVMKMVAADPKLAEFQQKIDAYRGQYGIA